MKLLSVLRATVAGLLTLGAAAALLACLAYPDAVVPPDPAKEYLGDWSFYALRGYVWVLPLAVSVFTAALSGRFFRCWFAAVGGLWLAALLACPVLRALQPEWVSPSLPFQGAMLPGGLGYMAIVLFGGYLLQLLMRFLFPEPEPQPAGEDAAVLDPAKARTVQQIAAAPLRPQPKFLFGEADGTLVARFGRVWRALVWRHRGRFALYAAAVAAVVLWLLCYPQPTAQEALARDLRVMKCFERDGAGRPRPTRAAVHAALRVMEHISDTECFAGMTRGEAEAWLGLDELPEDYRAQLRDASDLSIPSVDNAFESRERFLTLCDRYGHMALLYIRTDASGERINVSEVQDAGWNAVYDAERRRMGTGWRRSFFR